MNSILKCFSVKFACNSRTSKSIMETMPNPTVQFLPDVDRNTQFLTGNFRHTT